MLSANWRGWKRRARLVATSALRRMVELVPHSEESLPEPSLVCEDLPLARCLTGFVDPGHRSLRRLGNTKISWELYLAVLEFLRKGATAVDVGSGYGGNALFLASRMGRHGRLHCIEPSPTFLGNLKRTLSHLPHPNRISLHPLALTDQFGDSRTGVGPAGSDAKVSTLDELVQGEWPRLDFVNIEVDGMEHAVLRGARKTIAKYRPVVFVQSLMEFETFFARPVRKWSCETLAEMNYRLFEVVAWGSRREVSYPDLPNAILALPNPSH